VFLAPMNADFLELRPGSLMPSTKHSFNLLDMSGCVPAGASTIPTAQSDDIESQSGLLLLGPRSGPRQEVDVQLKLALTIQAPSQLGFADPFVVRCGNIREASMHRSSCSAEMADVLRIRPVWPGRQCTAIGSSGNLEVPCPPRGAKLSCVRTLAEVAVRSRRVRLGSYTTRHPSGRSTTDGPG